MVGRVELGWEIVDWVGKIVEVGEDWKLGRKEKRLEVLMKLKRFCESKGIGDVEG